MINWNACCIEDTRVIHKIAQRAAGILRGLELPADPLDIEMDVTAAHIKNPLRLEELLVADTFNFTHDVFGISRHIDRNTGKLAGHFSPRFSSI